MVWRIAMGEFQHVSLVVAMLPRLPLLPERPISRRPPPFLVPRPPGPLRTAPRASSSRRKTATWRWCGCYSTGGRVSMRRARWNRLQPLRNPIPPARGSFVSG
jgi:hypothetical protein